MLSQLSSLQYLVALVSSFSSFSCNLWVYVFIKTKNKPSVSFGESMKAKCICHSFIFNHVSEIIPLVYLVSWLPAVRQLQPCCSMLFRNSPSAHSVPGCGWHLVTFLCNILSSNFVRAWLLIIWRLFSEKFLIIWYFYFTFNNLWILNYARYQKFFSSEAKWVFQ